MGSNNNNFIKYIYMKKEDFFEELKDILELEDENIDFNTKISLDSLAMLSIIAFLDENFKIKVNAEQLKNITSINDILKIVGKENIQ